MRERCALTPWDHKEKKRRTRVRRRGRETEDVVHKRRREPRRPCIHNKKRHGRARLRDDNCERELRIERSYISVMTVGSMLVH